MWKMVEYVHHIRDRSENITGWGGGFSIFIGTILAPPSDDWQILDSRPTYNFLITPLYVLYGLI